MPVVVATIIPRPECRDSVRSALMAAIPAVHLEPGCLLYSLHEGPDRLVMIESWASRDAEAAHSSGPVADQLRAAFQDTLAAPIDLQILDALPAGDSFLGRVR